MNNAHANQPQPSKPSSSLRKDSSADIQLEIGRTFEVASVIEKAVHTDTGESLEQFIARAIARIFERTTETCLRIVRATNLKNNVCGEAGVSSSESDEFPCGRELDMWFDFAAEQQELYKRATGCVLEHGFVVNKILLSETCLRTEGSDMDKLAPAHVTSLVCCILRKGWGIEARNEIACYFDGDEETSTRNLTSAGDLRSCLAELSSHEPYGLILSILDKNDDSILAWRREGSGSVGLEVGSSERDKKSKTKQVVGVLETAGCVQDPEYGEGFWRGPENPEFMTPVLCNVLNAGGVSLESGKLKACLNVKRRFI